MKITSSGGAYEPAPEGQQQAVLVDWLDYGHPQNEFKGTIKPAVPVVEFVFQLEEVNTFGEHMEIRSKRFGVSWNEKANWNKALSQMLGKKAFDAMKESGECDLDALIGTNVWVEIVHDVKQKDSETRTYANIAAYASFNARRDTLREAIGYVRIRDRDGYEAPMPSAEDDNEARIISTRPVFVKSNSETYPAPAWMDYSDTVNPESMPSRAATPPPPRPAPDPRASNAPPTVKERAKAAGEAIAGEVTRRRTAPPVPAPVAENGEDDDDPFADSDDDEELAGAAPAQGTLMDAPQRAGYGPQ